MISLSFSYKQKPIKTFIKTIHNLLQMLFDFFLYRIQLPSKIFFFLPQFLLFLNHNILHKDNFFLLQSIIIYQTHNITF